MIITPDQLRAEQNGADPNESRQMKLKIIEQENRIRLLEAHIQVVMQIVGLSFSIEDGVLKYQQIQPNQPDEDDGQADTE